MRIILKIDVIFDIKIVPPGGEELARYFSKYATAIPMSHREK